MRRFDYVAAVVGIGLLTLGAMSIRAPLRERPTVLSALPEDSQEVIQSRAKHYEAEAKNYREIAERDEEKMRNRPAYERYWIAYLIVGAVSFLYGVRNT